MSVGHEMYRQLFEDSPDAIVVVDPVTFSPIDCNSRALGLTGLSREVIFSRPFANLFSPGQQALVTELLQTVRTSGVGECTALLQGAQATLPVRVSARCRAAAGESSPLFIFLRDIGAMPHPAGRQDRTAAALHDSEKYYAFIFEHIGVGITMLSPQLEILAMNSIMAEWNAHIDVSEHPICYKSFNNPPRDTVCTYCPTVQTLQDKQIHVAVTDTPTPQGIRNFRVIATPVLDEAGTVTGVIEVAEDITAQVRAEEHLRVLNDCFLGFGPDIRANINRLTAAVGRIMEATCALYNRLGDGLLCSIGQWQTPPDYQAEDRPEGHICYDVIRSGEREPLIVPGLQSSRYAASDPNVSRYGLKTYIGTPVFWGGQAVGSLCAVFDRDMEPSPAQLSFLKLAASAVAVEEARWHSEAALAQREEFISAILDSVDEGFLVIDRDFRIVSANRSYLEAVGHDLAGIVGRQCYEVSHHANRPCDEMGEDCAVREVFATGQPHAVTHRHEKADGTVRYVELKAYPLLDETGHVTSAIETVNDVTVQRQLAAEQLKIQKLEAIGTLAGGIAHDFNNLLQGVFGYLSLARLNLGDQEKAAAFLDQAERALNQSINLTGQLLTFAKGGRPVIRSLDLLPLIDNAAKFALSGARCDFRVTAPQPLWPVAADEGQVSQVIQNIVINAKEAMPNGGQVEIRLDNRTFAAGQHPRLPAGGRFVRITVADGGVGIHPDYLERVFDPYFTTKRRGSGLGLATSYSIVKQHGGLIEVNSILGEGSRFSIYLPVCEEEPSAGVAPPPAATSAGRVLVMDDEELVRSVAVEMLSSLGCEVAAAGTGEEAVETFRHAREEGRPFAAVILDLTVKGGMGGAETLAQLLRLDPEVRAIVSSGYAENSVIAEFRNYGFVASLSKPYRLDQLQATLQEVLGS